MDPAGAGCVRKSFRPWLPLTVKFWRPLVLILNIFFLLSRTLHCLCVFRPGWWMKAIVWIFCSFWVTRLSLSFPNVRILVSSSKHLFIHQVSPWPSYACHSHYVIFAVCNALENFLNFLYRCLSLSRTFLIVYILRLSLRRQTICPTISLPILHHSNTSGFLICRCFDTPIRPPSTSSLTHPPHSPSDSLLVIKTLAAVDRGEDLRWTAGESTQQWCQKLLGLRAFLGKFRS